MIILKNLFFIVILFHSNISFQDKNMIRVVGEEGTTYGANKTTVTNRFISHLMAQQLGYGLTEQSIKVPTFDMDRTEVSIGEYRAFIMKFAGHIALKYKNQNTDQSTVSLSLERRLGKIWSRNIILKSFYKAVFTDSVNLGISLRTNLQVVNSDNIPDTANTLFFVYDDDTRNSRLKELIISDYRPGGALDQSKILQDLMTKLNGISEERLQNDPHMKLLFYLLPYYESKDELRFFYLDKKGYDKYPVIGIDYYCAMFYAAWHNKRLPTEIEYETAGKFNGKGLHNRRVPFNCQIKKINNVFRLPANYRYTGKKSKTDYYFVKEKDYKQNGFYHLIGNVAEWMANAYHTNPYDNLNQNDSPKPHRIVLNLAENSLSDKEKGIEYLMNELKSIRGGHRNSQLFFLRIQTRVGKSPFHRSSTIGFRCATDY